jgi:toxin ParE1/3/4
VSIEIPERARWDIEEISDHIRLGSGAFVAEKFTDRLRKTLSLLESIPTMGELIEPGFFGLPGMRAMNVRQYPRFIVYFQPKPDGIRVLRVLHASRDLDALFGS